MASRFLLNLALVTFARAYVSQPLYLSHRARLRNLKPSTRDATWIPRPECSGASCTAGRPICSRRHTLHSARAGATLVSRTVMSVSAATNSTTPKGGTRRAAPQLTRATATSFAAAFGELASGRTRIGKTIRIPLRPPLRLQRHLRPLHHNRRSVSRQTTGPCGVAVSFNRGPFSTFPSTISFLYSYRILAVQAVL